MFETLKFVNFIKVTFNYKFKFIIYSSIIALCISMKFYILHIIIIITNIYLLYLFKN